MRVIADTCPDGPCPKIFELESGEIAVQGYDDARRVVPGGQSLVRIPAHLIREAAAELRAGPAVFQEEPPTGTATDSGPEIVDLGTGEVMVQGWGRRQRRRPER